MVAPPTGRGCHAIDEGGHGQRRHGHGGGPEAAGGVARHPVVRGVTTAHHGGHPQPRGATMVRSSSHAWRWSSRRSNKARPPRRRKAPQVDHPPPRRRCLLCPCSPCPHTARVLVQKLSEPPTPQRQRCSALVEQYRWQTHGTVVVAVEAPRSPRHGNGTQLRLQGALGVAQLGRAGHCGGRPRTMEVCVRPSPRRARSWRSRRW